MQVIYNTDKKTTFKDLKVGDSYVVSKQAVIAEVFIKTGTDTAFFLNDTKNIFVRVTTNVYPVEITKIEIRDL